jgi:cytochrome bd ubiquinol oxidase subunit I
MSHEFLLDVSRLQFATTAAFHMTFPAVTVGLGMFLALMYGMYMRTNNEIYLTIYRFWRKIFAIGFGLGVVAGIVLTFEFGLNWGRYAHAVGPILGVIIGMEVVTAFFLEAGFLGIMIYGDGRVGKRMMFFATCMVALGAFLSTTWILAANSWMQSPAGYELVNGQFRPTDWWEAIVNPSFVWRYPHMLIGVLLAASLLVTGVGAWYLIRGTHRDFARRTFSLGLGVISILIPIQLFVGDSVARFMIVNQPSKIEAMEGNWNSTNTGWNVFVIPDQQDQRNLVQVSIPCYGSILAGDWSCQTPVPGLKNTPPERQPPMVFTFWGFRTMFYMAAAIFVLTATGTLLRLRGRLYSTKWFHWLALLLLPSGVLAIIAGWVTAETGRQPWVVYGQLLTSNAVSPLSPYLVLGSLLAFVGTYAALLSIYIYYVVRLVRAGPDDPEATSIAPRRPGLGPQVRPVAGAADEPDATVS